MGAFLLRRILFGIFSVWCISVLVFIIYFVIPPGDPAQRLAGKNPTPERISEIRKKWAFDKSLVTQYTLMMRRTMTGTLVSEVDGSNVTQIILRSLPTTISLAVFAAIIWLAIGVTIGIKGALSPGTKTERLLNLGALVGISVPMAWLSIYSLKVWTDMIPIFPAGGYMSIQEGGIFLWMYHILLPATTLAVVFAGVYARMSRSNVRGALQAEHVKTAVAKGLPWPRVFGQHVLRTGMIPIVVMLGLDIAGLLGGAIFTETIFGLPGLGMVMFSAIGTGDFTFIIVGAMVAAAFVVIANILVDLAQAAIDPRIRLA